MGLFGLGKKKNAGGEKAAESPCCCAGGDKTAESACCCGSEKAAGNAAENACCGTGRAPAALTRVRVMGSGCKSCHALLENTNAALKAMNVPFEAEYVTDLAAIAAAGVLTTPALEVNGQVVSMGRVYSAPEVEKLLHRLGC